jgi:hypothetical protein
MARRLSFRIFADQSLPEILLSNIYSSDDMYASHPVVFTVQYFKVIINMSYIKYVYHYFLYLCSFMWVTA